MAAERLVQALAVGWSTAQLYPDPTSVPVFEGAVSTLGDLVQSAVEVEVTLDGFQYRGEPVDVKHGAAERLAQTLFSLNVEGMALVAPPTAEELAKLFSLLASEEAPIGTFQDRLEAAGITSFRFRLHRLLEETDTSEELETEERAEVVHELLAVEARYQLAADLVQQLQLFGSTLPREVSRGG